MGQVAIHDLPNSQVKVTVSNGLRIRLLMLLALCLFLHACSNAEKPKREAPPSPVAQADQPSEMSRLPPPDTKSVEEAVKRVFKESALIDTNHKPNFIAGDFNGDLSQDIAVVLKPVPEKLAELNEEFPNWILRDPFATGDSRVPRLRVAADDALLAVIHGYGANGWRDPQATQTYLLKNAVGSGLAPRSPKEIAKAYRGKKLPQLRGDVIGEQVGGTAGYLYYALSSYQWYDPKTFKGDIEPGMFHGARERKVKK
jgi:hypothetical protein